MIALVGGAGAWVLDMNIAMIWVSRGEESRNGTYASNEYLDLLSQSGQYIEWSSSVPNF